MDNKQIRIEPMIEPKASPKMEKMIKQYGVMWQKATQFGDLAKGNKELEKRLKYMNQWVSKDKELAKIMSQNSNKALENQRIVLQNIGKEVDKNVQRYQNAEKTAAKWAQRASGRAAARYSDLGGVPDFVNRNISEQQAGMAARIKGLATGNAMMGSEALTQQMRDEEAQKAGERRAAMWRIGVTGQAVAGAVGGVANMYFGYGMKKLGYQAREQEAADKLYGEITSGDYTSVLAIANQKGALKSLMKDQQSSTLWALGTQAAGGAFKTVADFASMGLTSGGNIAGGPMAVASAGTDYFAGKDRADAVSAAVAGMDYIKALSPVQMRQFKELTGRAGQVQELGMLAGGTGGAATLDLMGKFARSGLTLDQGMPLFNSLRDSVGQGGASGLIETAANSLSNFGVGRGAATQSLAGFAGAGGGAAGAGSAMVNTLARAVSAGITDSKLKEVLITTIPSLVNSGAMARGGTGASITSMITQSAAEMAKAGGRATADMGDLKVATSGFEFQNRLLGGQGGISPINVARQAGVVRLAAEFGISSAGKVALSGLSAMDIAEMTPNSPIWKMLAQEENMSPEQIEQFKERFASVGVNAYDTAMGGFKGHEIAGTIAVGSATGTQMDVATSGMSQARSGRSRPGPVDQSNAVAITTPEQDALNAQRVSNAANLMHPLFKALSDAKMVEGLRNVTGAAGLLADTLDRFERQGVGGLAALPAILDSVTQSVGLLASVATSLAGNLSTYGITGGAIKPVVMTVGGAHTSTGAPPGARKIPTSSKPSTLTPSTPMAVGGTH